MPDNNDDLRDKFREIAREAIPDLSEDDLELLVQDMVEITEDWANENATTLKGPQP